MSEKRSHIPIKLLKVTGWLLLGLVILLAAVRLSLKTSWVQNMAKNKAISLANQNIDGELSIQSLDGDLWKQISLAQITITQNTDTLLYADTLDLSYDVWSLLNRSLTVHSIRLKGAEAFIRETGDQEFNVQKLLKADSTVVPPEEETGPAFGIDVQQIHVQNTNLSFYSPSYLPDSTLSVMDVEATGGFSYQNQVSATLSSLAFQVREGRLPGPVSVSTAASYSGERITLNRLAVETSRSVLNADGFVNLADSSLQTSLKTFPFSLADLQPYLKEDIPEDELTIVLSAAGTLDSLQVEMEANGTGFDDLVMVADLSVTGTPALHKFGITGKNLDLAYFTNDSVDAEIGEFRLSAEGKITEEIAAADITWGFSLHQLRYEEYIFETLFGSGTLVDEKLLANIELNDGRDEVIANAEIEQLFTEKPRWNVDVGFENINLEWWTQNPELNSSLSFSVMAWGTGFSLGNEPWQYAIYKNKIPRFIDGQETFLVSKPPPARVDTSVIAGQKLSELYISGDISADSLNTEGYIQLVEDRVSFTAALANFLSDEPSYTYELSTSEFNVAEINNLSDFPSRLNLQLTGTGKYFEPEKMELNTRFLIDSSYVNGTSLDELSFEVDIREGIMNIPEGQLYSNVIDGTFSCRRNLFDRTDPENDLAVDLDVKNLQPLAPYIGAEAFNATGKVTGNITDNAEGELRFDGKVDLADIYLNDTFKAGSISGNTEVAIGEVYGFETEVDISEPVISGVELQDIGFGTSGIVTADSVAGRFRLQIKSSSGEIVQDGFYGVHLESLASDITWETFNFQTPARMLSLQHPFQLSYEEGAIKTDTLLLSDQSGTFLEFSVTHADTLWQQVAMKGQNFDVGIIQEIIFEERFVDGILSGDFMVSTSPQELYGDGEVTIRNLVYLDTAVDTLSLNFDVGEARLNAQLSMFIDGEEKAKGHLDVPFKVGDPTTFDDAFFEETVDGALNIKPIALSRFENILREFQIANTSGIISFNGSLSGKAGEPDFEGLLNLGDPVLSGIAMDSVFARFQYHHSEKTLTSRGEIRARGQQAAVLNAELPLYIDFRTFELAMAAPDDTLNFNMVTDNFNISVFNDFLDKQYMRNLKGLVNADVNITGTRDHLVPDGYFRLSKSEVNVPIAGIKLANIQADLSFTEAGMRLDKLSAKSGSGDFMASGTIGLDGVAPANLDINARASRFRLANTADYNLTIDLNSRLTGSPTQPKASGSLTIKNGFIYLQDFGEESVETVELDDEEVSTFSPYDSLAIDMRFIIQRNFFVRNEQYLDMEVELTGELEAQKQSNGELQLFGRLNGEDGYARPLGKLFELEEAGFTFSGPVDEPELNIRTSYIPQSSQKQGDPIVLYYIIEGNAQDPEFRFESEPYMEQQDIICYTLFSKPCYALESWQQVVSGRSGTTPADLLVDVLLDEVEALATRQLGIDVVQIDNTRSGSGGGTFIKTGWYLNRRTFFAIINKISGSTPETLFILEYLLTKNLDLILTQGDDSRQGIDLRWHYDY